MSPIFKDKKLFCLEYKVKKDFFLYTIKAFSEEDAIKRFSKKFADEIFGIYPCPDYEIIWVRRVHKKVQF